MNKTAGAFSSWISGSAVINEEGEPLMVFHGSRVPYIHTFDHKMEGTGAVNTGSKCLGGIWFTSSRSNAAFFADQREPTTADPESIFVYGESPFYAAVVDVHGDRLFEVGPCETREQAHEHAAAAVHEYNADPNRGEAIVDAYLALKNPYILDGVIPRAREFEFARCAGYDGIIARSVSDGIEHGDVYVVFSEDQICILKGGRRSSLLSGEMPSLTQEETNRKMKL